MKQVVNSLVAAVLAIGVLTAAGAAEAQPSAYPPWPVAWMVGSGYFGFSGYPWPGPPFAWPVRTPAYGCYFTHARLNDALRRVEVCY